MVVGDPSGAFSNRKNSASQPAIMAKPSFRARSTCRLSVVRGQPGERLLVRGVDVAEQPGYPAAFVVVGEDPEGVQIRLEEHVRFLDPDEALDRGAIEHDLPVQRLLELAARHLDVLVDAQDVGELKPDEIDAEPTGQLQDVILAGAAQVGGESLEARTIRGAGRALLRWGHEFREKGVNSEQ